MTRIACVTGLYKIRLVYLSNTGFRFLFTDDLEILSEQGTHLRSKSAKAAKECAARCSKLLERLVIAIVKHLAFEELPETFDEVEIRTIRRQGFPLNSRCRQIGGHGFRSIVPSVVADHDDPRCFGVGLLKLLKQGDGRGRVDGVVEAHFGTQRVDIDRPVDIESLPPGVARDGVLFAALDPTAPDHRIVLRMGGVDEVIDVCFCFVFLEIPVFLDERLLNFGCRVPGAGPAPAWLSYSCTPAGAGARSSRSVCSARPNAARRIGRWPPPWDRARPASDDRVPSAGQHPTTLRCPRNSCAATPERCLSCSACSSSGRYPDRSTRHRPRPPPVDPEQAG